MPVTECGKSRNDHCFIHEDKFFRMEKIKCSVVVSCGDGASFNIEEGNAFLLLVSCHYKLCRRDIRGSSVKRGDVTL